MILFGFTPNNDNSFNLKSGITFSLLDQDNFFNFKPTLLSQMSNRNCFLKCQIKGYIQNISRITFSIYDFLSLQTRIAFSISKSLNQDQPLASIFEGSLVLLEIMLSRTQASCFAVLFVISFSEEG